MENGRQKRRLEKGKKNDVGQTEDWKRGRERELVVRLRDRGNEGW